MTSSLVGSEMCIRDRNYPGQCRTRRNSYLGSAVIAHAKDAIGRGQHYPVSYTHLTLPTICSV
eukprot:9938666-Prorocentrum_lima.AAC.1